MTTIKNNSRTRFLRAYRLFDLAPGQSQDVSHDILVKLHSMSGIKDLVAAGLDLPDLPVVPPADPDLAGSGTAEAAAAAVTHDAGASGDTGQQTTETPPAPESTPPATNTDGDAGKGGEKPAKETGKAGK